jgi:hypothetical protein
MNCSAFLLVFIMSILTLRTAGQSPVSYHQQEKATNVLYGTWQIAEAPGSMRIKFTPDTLLLYVLQGHEYLELVKYHYTSFQHFDTIFVQTVDEVPLSYLFMLCNSNKAVMCVFKSGKGIEGHISNLTFIERVLDANGIKMDSHTNVESFTKDIFVLPWASSGLYAICYNQQDGLQAVIDSSGNRYFDLTGQNDNIIKLQSQPDFKKFLTKNIHFHYKKTDGSTVPLTTYGIYDTVNIERSQNHAFLVGFDRIARSVINKIVDDSIHGNILFVKIGQDAFYTTRMLSGDSLLFKQKYFKTLLSGDN